MQVSFTAKNAYHSPQLERSHYNRQDELALSDKKLERKPAVAKEKVMEARIKIEMLKQRYTKKEEDIKISLTQKAIKGGQSNPTSKDCKDQICLAATIKSSQIVDENIRKLTSPIEKQQQSSPNISQFKEHPVQHLLEQQTIQVKNNQSKNNKNKDNGSIYQKKQHFYQTSEQIVYEILSRKLSPKKQAGKHPSIEILEQTDVEEQIVSVYLPKSKDIYLPYDQQYADYQDHSSKEDNYSKERSIEQEIMLWLNHPQTFLADYIPRDYLNKSEKVIEPFVFISKNSSFNPLISSMITQFVLQRSSRLTQMQKEALYSLSLEFFYSNANQLSSQFLIILIKLGNAYLSKYSLFFKNNIEKYCHIILANRQMFSNEEKSMVVSFFADERQLTCQEIACLLLVSTNQQLISLINTKPFKNPKDILLLLSSLHLIFKQTRSYNGAYVKLINGLLDCIQLQQDTIENILGHVNTLTVGERYYQIHKQVKLRLIGIVSQYHEEMAKAMEKAAVRVKENESGGFKRYWSKAVDKLKTATNITIDKQQPQKQKATNLLKLESTSS